MAAKTRILIVDDDPMVLELLGMSLESLGFEYVSASDGLAALEEMEKQAFDIVITDMMMPRMDGMALLRHIHANHPKTGVIVVTGYTGTFSYTDVIRAGASDFISKPFNTDELEAKIKRILREQSLIRELEHLSQCDPLTGLFNRRHFDSRLREEALRAERQGYDLFLILIDIDEFKLYNDTCGHQAGDRALQETGRILMTSTREGVDSCFRYGGDEFAVIVPHANGEAVRPIAERIVEGYRLMAMENTGLSIGVARFARHPANGIEDDIYSLINRADKAMYRAKAKGRNRIEFDGE